MNRVSRATASNFALALTNVDDGGVTGFVDVDAITTGTQYGKSKIGSVDFDGFVLTEAANAQVQGTFGQAYLHDVVVEIQERETSFTGKIQNGGDSLKFSACISVGPELITDGERPIEDRSNPIVGARWTEGNVAFGVAETGNAAGRIVVVRHSAIGD